MHQICSSAGMMACAGFMSDSVWRCSGSSTGCAARNLVQRSWAAGGAVICVQLGRGTGWTCGFVMTTTVLCLQGEGDRHIPDLKPKHLFSGAPQGPAMQSCHLHAASQWRNWYRTGSEAVCAPEHAFATGGVRCRQARQRQDRSAVGRRLQSAAGRGWQWAAVLPGSAPGCSAVGFSGVCGSCMGKLVLLHSLQSNKVSAARFGQQHWRKRCCAQMLHLGSLCRVKQLLIK